MQDETQSSVLPFPPVGSDRVVDRIRELARDTFNISWTEHALEKLDERDVTTRQFSQRCVKGGPKAFRKRKRTADGESAWFDAPPGDA